MRYPMKRRSIVARALALAGLLLAWPPTHASAQQLLYEGAEFQVNTYTQGNQRATAGRSVARSSNGSFVVTWESFQDGSGGSVHAQRYDGAGSAVGTEFQVNTNTPVGQFDPAVAIDVDGDFVIVWTSGGSQDGSGNGIFAQRYDGTGATVGTEFQVNSYTTSSQYRPDVAMHADGSFVVVWDSDGQDGDSFGVHGQRYDAAGATAGTEFQVNTYTTYFQLRSAVAATGAGGFVVVWVTNAQDGASNGIAGQRYDAAGDPAGSEFIVNSYTSQNENAPYIASDGSGAFVVVFTSNQDPDVSTSIHGQRFDAAGAPLGTEFKANSYTTGLQSYPSVAMDGDGSFVVVWESNGGEDGFSYGVIGKRYDSGGAPDGTDFIVNTYTTYGQDKPSIAVDGIGNFTVVWDSQGQDDPPALFDGVFGQRLCTDENANLICDGDEITTTTSNTVTTTTSTSSSTTTTLSPVATCPPSPAPGCIDALRAKMQYNEKSAGREKMKIQWSALDDTTVQTDFGDPVDGATGIAACIYDDAGALLAQFQVDRAGQLCAGKPCWKKKGTKGYGYKDKDGTADGIGKLSLVAGDPGRGKASIAGRNNSTKGQLDLPTGVVAGLTLEIEPTLQILAGDGGCVTAKINSVVKDDGVSYKAARAE